MSLFIFEQEILLHQTIPFIKSMHFVKRQINMQESLVHSTNAKFVNHLSHAAERWEMNIS